jgi:repressor LexA
MSAEGESKYLSVPAPQNALKENVIAVRVAGDSMTGDDLLDGDYAIVDKGRAFRAGAIAVVRIGESEYADMAVKHVWREKDGLRLQGSNPDDPPTKVPRTESPGIEGMVIGVFRPASYRPLSK